MGDNTIDSLSGDRLDMIVSEISEVYVKSVEEFDKKPLQHIGMFNPLYLKDFSDIITELCISDDIGEIELLFTNHKNHHTGEYSGLLIAKIGKIDGSVKYVGLAGITTIDMK